MKVPTVCQFQRVDKPSIAVEGKGREEGMSRGQMNELLMGLGGDSSLVFQLS